MKEAVKDNGKRKGFWALLKASIAKSNDGCGPGCGCHAEAEKPTKAATGEGGGKTKSAPDVRH